MCAYGLSPERTWNSKMPDIHYRKSGNLHRIRVQRVTRSKETQGRSSSYWQNQLTPEVSTNGTRIAKVFCSALQSHSVVVCRSPSKSFSLSFPAHSNSWNTGIQRNIEIFWVVKKNPLKLLWHQTPTFSFKDKNSYLFTMMWKIYCYISLDRTIANSIYQVGNLGISPVWFIYIATPENLRQHTSPEGLSVTWHVPTTIYIEMQNTCVAFMEKGGKEHLNQANMHILLLTLREHWLNESDNFIRFRENDLSVQRIAICTWAYMLRFHKPFNSDRPSEASLLWILPVSRIWYFSCLNCKQQMP